jgi:ribose transport system permease protein
MMESTSISKLLKRQSTNLVVYLILALLIILTGLLSDVFFSSRNITNLLRQVAPLGFVSIGQTLAILTGGIDLSVGSVVSMVSCLTSGMINGQQHLVLPIVALVIALSLLVGFLNGLIISKTGVSPLIATLGMMSIVQGATLLYTKVPLGAVPESFAFLAWGSVGFVPAPILLFALVCMIYIIILQRSVFGRYVYATGGNENVAHLSGIKTARIKVAVYMMCSLGAALTGIFLVGRMGMGDPLIGDRYMLDSIVPVLIGGTRLTGGKGGIVGTIAGVFIFTVLSNALNLLNVSAYWQWVVEGLVVIISVAFTFRHRS